MTTRKGTTGKYQGRAVEVTEVNPDGSLNLIGTELGKASEPRFEKKNVPADQFTPDE